MEFMLVGSMHGDIVTKIAFLFLQVKQLNKIVLKAYQTTNDYIAGNGSF